MPKERMVAASFSFLKHTIGVDPGITRIGKDWIPQTSPQRRKTLTAGLAAERVAILTVAIKQSSISEYIC
ncbi:hypothetical protein OIU34_35015 [Pararhizobium sp. BT-229]|uniref:hypothetical protein n=1 Tax=Pararhizobium sp. BT-229 TaxID=2986923 RepID=UPI0021F6FF7F|nr:hypothetical protein [Pararhizobium sp. BT-229]MCV9967045.1 hypothetical protein [Pararhizobium sp. BT-229]